MRIILSFVLFVLPSIELATQTTEFANISSEERNALIELYESTRGKSWVHQDGWLGPIGTECKWYGIQCRTDHVDGVTWIESIDLMSNNLVGSIPRQITDLKHLSMLLVQENKVSVPEEILKKWDAGEIDLRFGTRYSAVSKITLTSGGPVLCVWEKFILLSDGSVTWFHERCKWSKNNARPTTFCEIKEGKTYEFDRLARFLETNGFFNERTVDPNRGIWIDVGSTEITVERNGSRKTLEIGSHGDGSLAEWSFDKAIRGLAMATEWTETRNSEKCPID